VHFYENKRSNGVQYECSMMYIYGGTCNILWAESLITQKQKKGEEGEEDGRCEVRSGKRLHGSKNVDVACM
jgi:hypothetical protein